MKKINEEKIEESIMYLNKSYESLKAAYGENGDPEYLLSDILTLINQIKQIEINKKCYYDKNRG